MHDLATLKALNEQRRQEALQAFAEMERAHEQLLADPTAENVRRYAQAVRKADRY